MLTKLFEDRGVEVQRTYQLNVGGNMDFKNMLERDRLESKKISQDAVGHLADPRPRPRRAQRAHRPVGLRRVARRPQVGLRPARGQDVRRRAAEPGVQARGLGLARTRPASSSTPLRAAKIAKDRGIGGPILSASSYFMKSPPVQYFDDEARKAVQDFIDGKVER